MPPDTFPGSGNELAPTKAASADSFIFAAAAEITEAAIRAAF